MAHSYEDLNMARHMARKTYMEKASDKLAEKKMAEMMPQKGSPSKTDAEGIEKERNKSGDEAAGDESEGAVMRKPATKAQKKKVTPSDKSTI